jgi:hypothetical protein
MSRSLDEKAFAAIARRLGAEWRMQPLIERFLESAIPMASRLAYYRNPHGVLTTRIRGEAATFESLAGTLNGLEDRRQAFSASGLAPITEGRILRSEREGGIYEGATTHDEIFLDASEAGALHAQGRSARLRTSTAEVAHAEEPGRVLLALTLCPVDRGYLGQLSPEAWHHLRPEVPGFEPLQPILPLLGASHAVPSLVECLTTGYTDSLPPADLIPALWMGGRGPGALFLKRKRSLRLTLRPWEQDPLTGVMQPDWAYVVLDEIWIEPCPAIAERLGEQLSDWAHFFQIELEFGPSPAVVQPSLDTMDQLGKALAELNIRYEVCFGRKVHRLLRAAGWPAGEHSADLAR